MQVDATLDLFNELQLQHHAVATKTKTLHDACDRLVLPLSGISCVTYVERMLTAMSFDFIINHSF